MSNLMPANLIGLTQLGIMRYRSDMNEPKLTDLDDISFLVALPTVFRLYLSNSKMYPVSLALKRFADATGATNWGAIFAVSVLSLIPVFALFIAFQRYIVEGISTTGLKG